MTRCCFLFLCRRPRSNDDLGGTLSTSWWPWLLCIFCVSYIVDHICFLVNIIYVIYFLVTAYFIIALVSYYEICKLRSSVGGVANYY